MIEIVKLEVIKIEDENVERKTFKFLSSYYSEFERSFMKEKIKEEMNLFVKSIMQVLKSPWHGKTEKSESFYIMTKYVW